jgi:hypothetical protein
VLPLSVARERVRADPGGAYLAARQDTVWALQRVDARHKSSITSSVKPKNGFGANDGARTHDIQDHNLALYQLSYVRHPVSGAFALSTFVLRRAL